MFESKLPQLSSSFTGLTRDPELCDEISSLHWLYITRLMGLAFAVGETSFEVVFCPRFDMAPDTVRSLSWERESFFFFEVATRTCRRWFHSSPEKLPLVRMSASWFLVSTYLIWILGSKLILSKNQSRATMWVLDTCLFVGLRPFDYHLNHCLVVFKNVQLIFTLRRMRVGGHVVHIKHLINLLLSFVNWVLGFRIKNCPSFVVASMLGLNCRQFPEDSMIGLNVVFVWT